MDREEKWLARERRRLTKHLAFHRGALVKLKGKRGCKVELTQHQEQIQFLEWILGIKAGEAV